MLAALAPLVPLVVVLDRAVMVDDPLFLEAAAQIRRDPLRPFDFVVNWYGWPEPFWTVFKNPPGLSYWLAGVMALLGDDERVLHASLLPFAAAAALAGVPLARRFAGASPWVTATWVSSPAFLVSAATLMADVPSLALGLWGLVLWIRGTDRDSGRCRRLGAVLAGLAVVVKYTAAVGLAALPLYACLASPRPRRCRRLVDLWPAFLAPAAWSALTLAVSGRSHIVAALSVGGGGLDPNPDWFPHRGIALLTFTAATGISPVLLGVAATGSRTRTGRAALAVALLVGVSAGLLAPRVWPIEALSGGSVVMVAVLGMLGGLALLVALSQGSGRTDPDARFLAVWLGAHVVYLWLWSWTIAARFVLPLLPPLVLLLGREILGSGPTGVGVEAADRRPGHGGVADRAWSRRQGEVLVAASAALALLVAVPVVLADGYAGDFFRQAIPRIAAQAQAEGRRALYVGSWAVHHYAGRAGLQKASPGAVAAVDDVVLQPFYAANRAVPSDLGPRLARLDTVPGPRPPLAIQTMNINVGSGLHSSAYGPLPFVFAALPSEGLLVWRVAW